MKKILTLFACAVVLFAAGCNPTVNPGPDPSDNPSENPSDNPSDNPSADPSAEPTSALQGMWKEIEGPDGLQDYLFFDGEYLWDLKYADGAVHFYFKMKYTDLGGSFKVGDFQHFERNDLGIFGNYGDGNDWLEGADTFEYTISADGKLNIKGGMWEEMTYQKVDETIDVNAGYHGKAWKSKNGELILGFVSHNAIYISHGHVKIFGWFESDGPAAGTMHSYTRIDGAGTEMQERMDFDDAQDYDITIVVKENGKADIKILDREEEDCEPIDIMSVVLFGQWVNGDRTCRYNFGLDGTYMTCYGMNNQHHWAEGGTWTWSSTSELTEFAVELKSTTGYMWNDESEEWYDAGTSHEDDNLIMQVSTDFFAIWSRMNPKTDDSAPEQFYPYDSTPE